ncbi:hypothetical protein F4775DRAFT_276995 [Biscogniauxia sp. FL1348]|nr:hypothetical protein F4775DRAFT_276995 [Biscogniauxia sp. FL1348]
MRARKRIMKPTMLMAIINCLPDSLSQTSAFKRRLQMGVANGELACMHDRRGFPYLRRGLSSRQAIDGVQVCSAANHKPTPIPNTFPVIAAHSNQSEPLVNRSKPRTSPSRISFLIGSSYSSPERRGGGGGWRTIISVPGPALIPSHHVGAHKRGAKPTDKGQARDWGESCLRMVRLHRPSPVEVGGRR